MVDYCRPRRRDGDDAGDTERRRGTRSDANVVRFRSTASSSSEKETIVLRNCRDLASVSFDALSPSGGGGVDDAAAALVRVDDGRVVVRPNRVLRCSNVNAFADECVRDAVLGALFARGEDDDGSNRRRRRRVVVLDLRSPREKKRDGRLAGARVSDVSVRGRRLGSAEGRSGNDAVDVEVVDSPLLPAPSFCADSSFAEYWLRVARRLVANRFDRSALRRETTRRVLAWIDAGGGLRLLYLVLVERERRTIGELLRRVVLALEDDDGAVLMHCSAGKDRTGLAATLLLRAVGVDWATLLEHYGMSTRLLDPNNDDERPNALWSSSSFRRELTSGSPPGVLDDVLSWLESEHGSVDAYLDHPELGFTEEWRERLRRQLTMPVSSW